MVPLDTFLATRTIIPSPLNRVEKSTKAKVFDSLVVAAIAFFGNLIGTGWPPSLDILWGSGIAFGMTFFLQLAAERGIRRYSEKEQAPPAPRRQDEGEG